MAPVDEYCTVTPQGVAHLFLGLDYGKLCVCGRKTFVFATENEAPSLRDVTAPPGLTPALAATVARHGMLPLPMLWRTDLLLAWGEDEIRRARQVRTRAQETREQRSRERAEWTLSRGARAVLGGVGGACDDAGVNARSTL
jgi:hypothetical protein